jgi:hypothetical protein
MSDFPHIDCPSEQSTSVWEATLFKKIPSPNPKVERGNLFEVATEIALKWLGSWFEDLTNRYHEGNLADFETIRFLIECKHWFTDHYRITVQKVEIQILPRYTDADDIVKVLIIPEGCKWDAAAERLVLQNGIHIIEVPRIEKNRDILWVAHRIKEELSRICRIDHYSTDIIRDPTSNHPRNRFFNLILRVLSIFVSRSPLSTILGRSKDIIYSWREGVYSWIVGFRRWMVLL